MAERALRVAQVQWVVESGEIIESDLNDVPYPSYLILGFLGDKPLHVVVGVEAANQRCYVVTVYEPDPGRWSSDFRRRLSS
ncbi:MAG: DUF4258 domain-containing protein [Deltaproteobacteria bacterium]|nr:DUF4258 domain-containing protein [Deltaproteobacteria bacterium]